MRQPLFNPAFELRRGLQSFTGREQQQVGLPRCFFGKVRDLRVFEKTNTPPGKIKIEITFEMAREPIAQGNGAVTRGAIVVGNRHFALIPWGSPAAFLLSWNC